AKLTSSYLHALETLSVAFPPQARSYFLERRLTLDPLSHGFSNARGRFRSPLLAMMVLVALVLLIACANTANLLMARAEGRRREIAVRLSIGAGRGRLIQQLLTESLLLVAIAAALGLAIAQWASDQLVRMALGVAEGPAPFSTGIDSHVLVFTAAIAVATGLLFGLAPAFRATNLELNAAAKPSRSGRFQFGGAKLLVAVQVALSLIVVVGAALFARSLRNLAQVDLGFDREHVLTVWMNPRVGGYAPSKLPALYRDLVQRAESIPGVRSAAVSMCGLDVECRSSDGQVRISGYQPAPGEDPQIQYNAIDPGYFATVGMTLLSGRDLRPGDTGRRYAVINEAMVRRYFAGRNPLGQHFGDDYRTEIVGVIRDARVNRVREEAAPMAYFPLDGNAAYGESLEVRAAGDPDSVATAVRKTINEVAPDLPIDRITPLALQVDRSLNPERMGAVVTTAFGILALSLACFGLYGVMSYAVSRRTSEIGVRMALGARPRNVLWNVLREALWLIVLGLAAGLPAVIFSARFTATLLYGIRPNDPATLGATIAILTTVAIFAAVWPAWRASRVSPLAALRHE
ncbi:MAG TPA: FtsX-like permease family protein, partial [Bryobacteraceae bacterium]|nr:FtsX-like permease family protein [Bryobacteraceae bacterium]